MVQDKGLNYGSFRLRIKVFQNFLALLQYHFAVNVIDVKENDFNSIFFAL